MTIPKIPVSVELLKKEGVKIYRMTTLDFQGNASFYVCAYLIDGLLIDCGHHHAKDEFLKILNLNEVEYGVLSHSHEDHYGAAYDLINKFNIPVYATKETVFMVHLKIWMPPERKLVWGIPTPVKVRELTNYEEITTKELKFKIIPSPGHCKNLISFFHEKKNLLFSTDAFINSQQSVIFNWENANQILETLKYFRTLKFKYMFLEDGNLATKKDLVEFINYWTDLKEKSQKFYDKGWSTKLIVKQLFGKESILKKLTGGDLSRENLIRSLINLPALNIRKTRKRRGKK